MGNNNQDPLTLSPEEKDLVLRFRQEHRSAAERRQKFIEITDKPVSAWMADDYKYVEALMPALISGKMPFRSEHFC
jgi:hypothetical protein